MRTAALAAGLMMMPMTAHANWFVVSSTHTEHREAQDTAAEHGGWVLNGGLYHGLKSGEFHVVHGPFADKAPAQALTKRMKKADKGVKLKHAGEAFTLPGLDVDPNVLVALLGEVSIKTEWHKGGESPCEPQEPYQEVTLEWSSVQPQLDPAGNVSVQTVREDAGLQGFWVLQSTGAVERMRACLE